MTSPNSALDPVAQRRLRLTGLALALVAFALNVVSLVIPFLSIDTVLSGSELYSLPRSVELLWESGLHVLALLVVAFSIVFPFVKLAILIAAGLGIGNGERRRRRLEVVGRLGRWSMLDVFLAAILLGLTNDRFFVDTEPRIGLVLFALAIALALVAGEVLERERPMPEPQLRRRATGRERALLAVTWAFLAAAIVLPFLRVSDWRLEDDSFSLAGLVAALWQPSAFLAAFLATTLVLVPLCELVALSVAATATGARVRRAAVWRAHLERWAMLDVFVFALAIFLVEGSEFVETEVRFGVLLLVGAVGLYALCRNLLERRLRRPRPAG